MASKTAAKKKKQEKLLDRDPIPPGYISPGNSPFLKKLPRELRGKVYDELLIVRFTAEDEDKYDKIKEANILHPDQEHEWKCKRELDFLDQEYLLMPDLAEPNEGIKYIRKNKGILLANKQIYEEATSTLFGKNMFGALPQSELVCAFWRCHPAGGCVPRHRPCLVRPETAAKIKHLFVIINNPKDLASEVANLKINLRTIVDTFLGCGNHFLTFKLRYWSPFGGEVEAVRGAIEGPLWPGTTKRSPVMIRHATTGKFHRFEAIEFDQKLFKNIDIVDQLKKFKRVADLVDIRGDLPQRSIDELTSVLSTSDPTPAVKRARRSQRRAAAESQSVPSFQAIAAQFRANDPTMDPATRAFYQSLTRAAVKSPAVKSQFFPEMYDGSMRLPIRDSERSPQQLEQDVSNSTPSGGIGVIDGKPVFGPPRPPAVG